MSTERHAEIDYMAARAKAEAEIKAFVAIDRINIKIAYWIRSDAQKRRWENAKKVDENPVEAFFIGRSHA